MEMAYESIEDNEVKLLLERIKKESQTGFNLWYLMSTTGKIVLNVSRIAASLSLSLSFFLLPAIPVYMKLLLTAGILLTFCYGIWTTAKISKADSDFWTSCVNMNVLFAKYYEYVEDYSAGKDVRIYGMADHLADNMKKADMLFFTRQLKNGIKKSLITLLNNALKYGTYIILIFASLAGAVTVGSIAKYVSCIVLLLSAVSELVGALQLSFANNAYLKRYFAYFDIPNNMYKGNLTIPKRDDNEYFIEFRDVSFRYPGADAYALYHVNIRFQVGEKLAVVGMNGSGKTTFIKLLCRLYDPTEGEILLNGVDIRKYDYDEYLSMFSVVFQDFRLLAYTLGQNVAAAVAFDRKRAADCLRRAGFDERMESMPQGLDTYLYKNYNKDGAEISGCAAQKTALVRALYKNAPFIILDEPTAALDPVSECGAYTSFNTISGDKTVIYISHRLAACRFCDKIAVFDRGRIIKTGSHDELISDKNGRYYALWNAQAQYYTE